MPLRIPDQADPPTRALLEWVNDADAPPLHGMSAPEARLVFDERRERVDLAPVPVARCVDSTIAAPGRNIPIRIYDPRGDTPQRPAPPVLVWFHGGGFVIGGLDSHDALCRRLANRADCMVIAVDYRLAPEHPYPAAAEDAVAALDWIAANAATLGGDAARIAVAGDSAGGNLAAIAAHHARDRGAPALRAQILVYPALDPVGDYESVSAFADVFPIDKATMAWFYNHYYGRGAVPDEPWAAPGLVENLSGLAPATILTAGLDPLRDEARAYADRLQAAGVPIEYYCYEGTIHGFAGMGKVLLHAEQAIERMGKALAAAFA